MFPKMGVQAIVKGIDDYLRDVGKMEKANENFNEEVGKVGTGKLAQFGAGAKNALTGLGIAGGIAAGGVLAVREAYQKTIAVTVAYNKNILDTANALGTTTEEYSRIVQVADDFGISQETVNAALEMATKKGFTVTIDSLAELADRTNAILDPTKRAAELAEVFGRGWASLNPLLKTGGKNIRALAEGIDDSLVVTQAEVDASEELRVEIDTLNDSWQGLMLTLGQKGIPITTKFVDFLNRAVKGLDAFNDPAYSAVPPILRGLKYMSDTAKERDAEALVNALLGREGRIATRTQEWATGLDLVTLSLEEQEAAAKAAQDALQLQAEKLEVARKASIEFYDVVGGRADEFFSKLDTYARKYELGGVDLRIADAQVQELLKQGVLSPEDARLLANAFMPIEVVRKAAQDAGWDLGETVTKEMKDAIKEKLVAEGLSEKEAGAVIKAFVAAPENWIETQMATVLDTIKRLALEQRVATADYQQSIATKAMEIMPTLTGVYGEPAKQIERAIILAEQLNSVLGGTWTSTPTINSPKGAEEGTGPMVTTPTLAAAGGGGQTFAPNYNLTVNSNAPTEQVVADFGMMRALARRR